jgi:hypothetical protein
MESGEWRRTSPGRQATTSKQEKRCINTRAAIRLQKATAARGASPFALLLPDLYLHPPAHIQRVDHDAHRQTRQTVARPSTLIHPNSKHAFVSLSQLFPSSSLSSRARPPALSHLQLHLVCTFPLPLHLVFTSPRPAAAMAYFDDDPGSQLSSELTSLSTSRESSPLSSVGGKRTPSPPPPEIHLSDATYTMYHKARTLSHVDPSLPTPPPSQENSQSGSPAPDAADSAMLSDKDAPPPAKRRRVGPKERTTRSLDLRSEHVDSSQQSQFDDMLRALHKRQKIVVVAGAGISVAAGSA